MAYCISSKNVDFEHCAVLISVPCFSLFAPCDFYLDHVFHFNPPVVFIQTAVFQNVTLEVLL